MYEILPQSDGPVIGLRISDTLTRGDFDALGNELRRRTSGGQRLKVLILMEDFRGWQDAGALLKDMQVEAQAARHIDRLAIVGETRWQEWLSRLAEPLGRGMLRYFEHDDLEQAWEWLRRED